MNIKLLKPWGMSSVGDILYNINESVAELLIKRKIAELIVPKKKGKK